METSGPTRSGPQGPGLVIFDCDGVLVDSEHLSHRVLLAMLEEHGVSIRFEEAIDRFLGTSGEGFVGGVSDLLRRPAPPHFLEQFRLRCLEAFEAELGAVDGVEPVLRSLSMPFCVASNGRHVKMQVSLRKAGLLPYFPGRIFSAEDVPRPKPAPDLFLHAAQSLGVAAEHCVVVEDSPTGIQAARAAGMTALGFAGLMAPERLRAAGALTTFTHMSQVPALLQSALTRR